MADFSFEEDGFEQEEPETGEQEEVDQEIEVDPDNEIVFEEEPVEEKDDDGQGKDNEDKQEGKDSDSDEPNSSVYSSFAKALKEDGIFTSLSDDKEIKTADDFNAAIKAQIEAGLNEQQKRVLEALDAGVPTSAIAAHEKAIEELDSITDEELTAESEDGQEIRKTLILYAAKNRGLSDEQAKREVEKSIKAGTDIEDAKDALEFNKKTVNDRYNAAVNETKKNNEEREKSFIEFKNDFSAAVMDQKEGFWKDVPENIKKKAVSVVNDLVYQEKGTNRKLSELTHYSETNPKEFLMNVSLAYAVTNGFKNWDNIIKITKTKATKSAMAELEKQLKGSSVGGNRLEHLNNLGDENVEVDWTL